MIVKRIRRSARRQRRPLHHVRTSIDVLTTYVLHASPEHVSSQDGENALARYVFDEQVVHGHKPTPGEKVDLYGARNLVGDDLAQHQRQMLAANLLAPDAKDPIEHYVLSWQICEAPTREQIEEAIDIFASEMGYDNCQIVWATHSNTQNYHLHLVVNRIDLSERTVVSPGDGWEIDRLHQIVALIEDQQGWISEPNAIYAARGGEVRERATSKIVRRADGSRDGCATRTRTAPEKWRTPEYADVVDALRTARTWQDLHNRLLELQVSYRTKGTGAEIIIGKARMKATSFGREFAYRRMTARLGEYTPDLMAERDPFEIYREALRAERKRVRDALNTALADLAARRKRALQKAKAEAASYEAMISEARLQLVFDLAEAEVKKAFDRARMTIAETSLRRDAWYKANCPTAITVKLPELIHAPNVERDASIAGAHGLTTRCGEFGVEYCRDDGQLMLTDVGVLLIVHQLDKNAIAASLAMASERCEQIIVAGSAEFLDICREIAKKRGYTVLTDGGEMLHEPAVEIETGDQTGGKRSATPAKQSPANASRSEEPSERHTAANSRRTTHHQTQETARKPKKRQPSRAEVNAAKKFLERGRGR